MNDALPRLNAAIDYLKDSGQIHKQQDIADTLGMTKGRVSSALSGDTHYLTKGFLRRFAEAYPLINAEWLLTGEAPYDITVAVSDVRALYQVVVLLRRF